MLTLPLPRVWCLLLAALMLSMPSAARGQAAKRSNILPFKRYVDPTQARPRQEKDPNGQTAQPQAKNGGGGQRPWESNEQPLDAQTLENAQIIARVGSEVILAGEVLSGVDKVMEANQKQIPPSKWDEIRRRLMQQMLMPLVQQKLIVVNAMEVIPEDALPEIEKQVEKQFYGEQIKEMMKLAEVNSLAALEIKLKESGSSIEQQKRIFFERSLASQWMHQQVVDNRAVTHLEMLEYYSSHLEDYQQPDRCRWEQLTARFDKFSSREAAWRAIAEMGNAVADTGIPFETVAKEKSQGLTASAGGARDWTTRGALVSGPLDEALFSLPIGTMSPIIADSTGYHIIRVVERVDAHCTPFRDAQIEIQQSIVEGRREAKLTEYLDSLREKTYVWTIFDDVPAPGQESGKGSVAMAKEEAVAR